ncbi:MAG: sigma 54-interacting transcriptional regulator, partial [Planctomycetota bacterium]
CSLYYERELRRELFGYRGAGMAGKTRKGLLEFAARGTCYLSRVEELTFPIQESLAHFLDTGRFVRLGDGRELSSKARLVVSTERNLSGLVQGGLFRRDLFDRLAEHGLDIQPLRERPEDVESIAKGIADRFAKERGLAASQSFDRDGLEALKSYPWPQNVDELRRELERVLASGVDRIGVDNLSFEIASYWRGRAGDPEVRKVVEELEGYIREFKVLSQLDAEYTDVLLSQDATGRPESRERDHYMLDVDWEH